MYTILDMHQDVLWQAGADEDQGYWGIPPWAKHKLDPPGPNVIKLFCQKFTNFLNKLKHLSLASLSSLV